MIRRRLLLAVTGTLLLAQVVSACGEEKERRRVLFAPPGITDLSIASLFAESETLTCGQPGSWLLRIDTSMSATAVGWDYTLLLNSSHDALFGCVGQPGGGRCPAGTSLQRALPNVSRVMVEGLDVEAPAYGLGSANVICRAVADDLVNGADIEIVPSTSPTPKPGADPSPTPFVRGTIEVTLRFLRVGSSNPLPFGGNGLAPARVRYGAAASFSDPNIGPIVEANRAGGRIAFAGGHPGGGGVPVADIWEFVPQTLSFEAAGVLPTSAAGLSATSFPSGGFPVILFAGGQRTAPAGTGAGSTLIHYPAGIGDRPGPAVSLRRAFHTVTRMKQNGPSPALLFFGGMTRDLTALLPPHQTPGLGQLTFFAPENSVSGCLPETFCDGTTYGFTSATASAQHVAIPYADERRVWVGGGVEDLAGTTQVAARTFSMLENNGPVPHTSPLPSSVFASIGIGMPSGTGSTLLDGKPIIIGGFTSTTSFGASRNVGLLDDDAPGGGPFPTTRGRMRLSRGEAAGLLLRDFTVFIAGGRSATHPLGNSSFEFLVPMPSGTPRADFAAMVRGTAGGPAPSCFAIDTNQDPAGCEQMKAARWGHTATRLDGTGSWLDGSVLLIGGAIVGPTAELFVPAYACDGSGSVAVSPGTGVPLEAASHPLPLPCDRGRAPEILTDPTVPR